MGKKPTIYTAVQSNAALELCREINVDRIVINSNCPNMFVLERSKNFTPLTIKESTKVLIGIPSKPLPEDIINKLITNFKKVESVQDAYQYTQAQDHDASITIGLKLSPTSENAKIAAINAVQNALLDEGKGFYIDVFIIESDDWYDLIKNVEDSLFYKK